MGLATMTSAAYQKKKEWVMNQESLDRLLGFLDPDREAAQRKYERIKEKLTNLFRWRGCPHPGEYAAKTIEGAARELPEGGRLQVQNPYLYFHRVAINVSNALKEQWASAEEDTVQPAPDSAGTNPVSSSRRSGPETRAGRNAGPFSPLSLFRGPITAALIDSSENEPDRPERERQLQCMRECLSALSLESLELLAKYHRPGEALRKESRKELARSLNISQAALRMRVFRIRASLARSVTNCLGRSRSNSPRQNGAYSEHGHKG